MYINSMHIKYVSISTVKVTKISWEYESIGFSVHLSRSFSVGIFSFEVIIVVEMVASRALYGSGNHVIYLSYYLLPFSAAECPAYHGLCVAHLKPEVAMVSAVKHIRYCQIAHRCMSYRNMHEKKRSSIWPCVKYLHVFHSDGLLNSSICLFIDFNYYEHLELANIFGNAATQIKSMYRKRILLLQQPINVVIS